MIALATAGLLTTTLLALATPANAEVTRREEGTLILENVPEIPAVLRDRLRQFQNIRSASFVSFVPDSGSILVATRFGNTSQLHRVDAPMGMRRQITFYDEPVGDAEFARSGLDGRFLVTMDKGGSEFDQIYLFDPATGRERLLTDGVSANRGPLWANTSPRFVHTSTGRNGRDWDLVMVDLTNPDDPATTMVLEVEGAWYPLDWSPDDSKLLVGQSISANESYLHVLDLASGELSKLNPQTTEPVAYRGGRFSHDGAGVFYGSDMGAEFITLRYHDLAIGVSKALTDDIRWDVSTFDMTPDGRLLAFATNENGLSKVYLLRPKTLSRTEVPVPTGIVSGLRFDKEGNRLAMTLSAANAPADVYVYDLAAEALTRWTESEVGGLPPGLFVGARLVEYPTFDAMPDGSPRRIPAFLFEPRTPGPWPVLVDIHGGPEGQSRPGFNAITQYLAAELGIAVIKPNVRGSSGYGKTYLKLDNGMLREDSVKDIGALLDWIGRQPELDASRVAVYGGSYGGYMVLASLAHYSDRLAAGIDVVGISNFVTFLESTNEYRRDLRRVEYGDERDPAMRAHLEAISPTTNVHRITRPLFVAQGYNDPRVPYTEAEQIVRAVRANDQEVWYFLAMDEGHGFAKKSNRDEFTSAMVLFLERHLLGRTEGP
jgi:dipeptidyl aminopeptidase/acylaminoacyl peptidase